jgi:dTDP-4-amino-4,6-dideoxygalactose transaminase
MAKLAIQGGDKTVTLSWPGWPQVGEEEIAAVVAALRKSKDDWQYLCSARGEGPTGEFEQQFAQFMGTRYAMCTCGGGPALHIAVMAAGVKAGDEVIVSAYTWGQTVSCILQQNAIPVFADIDPQTYTLDAASIEERITDQTRAIVVVHIYGHPADMDAINEVANRYGLPVIEDSAQAVGAKYKGRRVGSLGDIGCYSIGDGKNMIGGEGGVLVCDDDYTWQAAHLYGQHPMRSSSVVQEPELREWIDSLIYTYRIHPLAAVIAGVQLKYVDQWNAERRANHEVLFEGLKGIPGIQRPYVAPECEHVYHIGAPSFVPEEVEGISRETYVEALAAEGVPIGMGYVRTPIHLRKTLQERQYFYGKHCPWSCGHAKRKVTYEAGDCPVAQDRCERTELTLGGGCSWRGDQSAVVQQTLDAFHKVTENLEVLRDVEKGKRT